MEDRYQVALKANYINILLLEDEIEHLDVALSKPVQNIDDFIEKFRTTRTVFLTLYNVKDLTSKLQIRSPKEYTAATKSLRSKLEFANHFRNKGIGHLDTTLLKRAVQWEPTMFVSTHKNNKSIMLLLAQKASIESCINSYLDKEGVQKIFGHEIDLLYPPDGDEFYSYLSSLVQETNEWLKASKDILHEQIKFHSPEYIFELAVVAGATNFNLKEDSDLSYDEQYSKSIIAKSLDNLVGDNIKQDKIDGIKKKFEI